MRLDAKEFHHSQYPFPIDLQMICQSLVSVARMIMQDFLDHRLEHPVLLWLLVPVIEELAGDA